MADRTVTQFRAIGGHAETLARPIAQTALPANSDWGGYWTYVIAVILGFFVIYLAQKGRLSAWVALFTLPIQPIGTASNAASNPITSATSTISSITNGLNSVLTGAQSLGSSLGKLVGLGGS